MKTIEQFIEQERQKDKDRDPALVLQKICEKNPPEDKEHICFCIRNEGSPDITLSLHPYERNQKECVFFHNHSYFEMVYLYQGTATNRFADTETTLYPGDVLLLNPHIPHFFYTEHPDDIAFNIFIPSNLFDQSFFLLISDNGLFTHFFMDYVYQINQVNDYMLFRRDPENDASQIFNLMIQEYINQPVGYKKAMESYLSLICVRLARAYNSRLEIGCTAKDPQKIVPIVSYIKKNYVTATLKSTAEHFGYSEKYLSRMIKKYTGKTFNDILTNCKLEYARELLSNSAIPIDQISTQIGYSDTSYFYKVFKKRYMQTPAQWRKSLQLQDTGNKPI